MQPLTDFKVLIMMKPASMLAVVHNNVASKTKDAIYKIIVGTELGAAFAQLACEQVATLQVDVKLVKYLEEAEATIVDLRATTASDTSAV